MKLGLILVALAAASAPAFADESYEQKATGAALVAHVDDLVFATLEKCDRPDDVTTRQCRKLRDARRAALTGKPLLVAGPELVVGEWSSAKKSADVSLASCIACAKGATPIIAGAATKPIVVRALPFATQADRDTFAKSLAGARTELVVTLAATQPATSVALDVVAYRVIANGCAGQIILSAPASGPVPSGCKQK